MIAVYCTICYTTTCFGPCFRPSSGCLCLALRILYFDDNLDYFDDEISVILSLPCFYGWCIGSSIWMATGLGCGMAAMDNVSCFGFFFCSVSLVLGWLSLFSCIPRCLLLGWRIHGISKYILNSVKNSEISLDISREFYCQAVGSRQTLGYPRATITPLCFRCHGYGFLGIRGKKYFGGALRAVKFGVPGTNIICIFGSYRPARLSFKLSTLISSGCSSKLFVHFVPAAQYR
jgi:hypothetical protein